MSDAAFPMDALLREREWVRALARSLVRSEAEADDLEQDAWVEALRRPPADARSPRGWLATVMHRLAGRGRRTSTRVRRRETGAARPESLPAAADLVAVAEQHRRLVGLVLELEEPLRGALLARYVEGLPPREIAARSGEPLKTVKSRIARGLERLRVRLDAESGGARERWLAALAPVAALGGNAKPAGESSPTATGIGTAAAVGGGMLMATKAKATAGVVVGVLLAGGAVWLAARPPAGDAPAAVGDAGGAAKDAASLAAAPRPAGAANAGVAAAGAPAKPAGEAEGVVLVRVLERAGEKTDAGEKAIPGAAVFVRPNVGAEARGTTGPAGEPARVAISPEAAGAVWAWAEGFAPEKTKRPQGFGASVDVTLTRGKPVAVSFMSDGEPPRALTPEEVRARYGGAKTAVATLVPPQSAGMSIPDMIRRRFDEPSSWTLAGEVGLSADSARLFGALGEAAGLVLVERFGDEPYLAWVEAGEGGALRVRVPLRESPTRVRVRVVEAESGTAVPGAVLTPYAEAGQDALFLPGAAVTADARGEVDLAFDSKPAPSTRPATWWVTAPGRAASIRSFELRSKSGEALTVRVPKTVTVRGHAWTGGGAPAAGGAVLSGWKGRFSNAIVAADGTYSLPDVAVESDPMAPGKSVVSLMLVQESTGAHMRQKVAVTPGETVEIDFGRPPSRDTATVRGRVTAGGRPLPGVHVGLMPNGNDKDAVMGLCDGDGRFEWKGLVAGPYALVVLLGDPGLVDDFTIRSTKMVTLSSGEERSLDFDLPGGTLRVRVVDDRTGAPVPGAVALATPKDKMAERNRFPGFEARLGWAGLSNAQGIVTMVGLPVGVPHLIEAVTVDRRLKGGAEGALPIADPAGADVEVRVK